MEDSSYLRNLAISETGFIFNPSTGHTYLINETARFILQMLKDNRNRDQIQDELLNEYEAVPEQASRDIADFFIQLTELGLLR